MSHLTIRQSETAIFSRKLFFSNLYTDLFLLHQSQSYILTFGGHKRWVERGRICLFFYRLWLQDYGCISSWTPLFEPRSKTPLGGL